MKQYLITIVDGKVVGDSAFYLTANDMLEKECNRICTFSKNRTKIIKGIQYYHTPLKFITISI